MSVKPSSPALAADLSWRRALAERFAQPDGSADRLVSCGTYAQFVADSGFSGLRLARDGAC